MSNKNQVHAFGKVARMMVEQTFAIEEALSKKEVSNQLKKVVGQISKMSGQGEENIPKSKSW